jgi:hypothetical protein
VRRPLVQPVLRQQEHPEGLEPRVPQGELVALVVLTEPAGAAGARREVDVAPGDLGRPDSPGLAAQEVDQVPGGEAGRAALPDVGHLAAGEKVLLAGRGQRAGPIA